MLHTNKAQSQRAKVVPFNLPSYKKAGITSSARLSTVTMAELFRDLPPGHPLFEQFSFVPADELAKIQDLMSPVVDKYTADKFSPDMIAQVRAMAK